VGVTGTSAANAAAAEADVILAVGTRLQDFTTGSWALFGNADRQIIGLNVQPFDAGKHLGHPLVADAAKGLQMLSKSLGDYVAPAAWTHAAQAGKTAWMVQADAALAADGPTVTATGLPSDAQVIGAVLRTGSANDVVVCASGGLPGELHKLWRAERPGHYHLEYGFSCMGYEIAGGLGVKMAHPEAEIIVMVGDGSYLMLNSELATAVMLGLKLTVVLLDNRGFGCINRLQRATGGASFNNLLVDAHHTELPNIDFAAHAAALGAQAVKAANLAELEAALIQARAGTRTSVIVIDTDPLHSTAEGGHWWDVAIPEVSQRAEVRVARTHYEDAIKKQTLGV
jgi:3D-(3,5/4)-trihydroxycyclohexane-1,2-dione acylhydrolase (decyclizing)